jgi:hypothetical protein
MEVVYFSKTHVPTYQTTHVHTQKKFYFHISSQLSRFLRILTSDEPETILTPTAEKQKHNKKMPVQWAFSALSSTMFQ